MLKLIFSFHLKFQFLPITSKNYLVLPVSGLLIACFVYFNINKYTEKKKKKNNVYYFL